MLRSKALEAIKKMRDKHGIEPARKTTVYRYIKGDTHRRGGGEKRGRTKSLSKTEEVLLFKTRKRLVQAADGQRRVTHAEVHKDRRCIRGGWRLRGVAGSSSIDRHGSIELDRRVLFLKVRGP